MWISSPRPRRLPAGLLLALGAVVATYVACIPSDPCLRNSDCTHGERCIEGTCAVPPPSADTTEFDAASDAPDTDDAGANDAWKPDDATDASDADEASEASDASDTRDDADASDAPADTDEAG